MYSQWRKDDGEVVGVGQKLDGGGRGFRKLYEIGHCMYISFGIDYDIVFLSGVFWGMRG